MIIVQRLVAPPVRQRVIEQVIVHRLGVPLIYHHSQPRSLRLKTPDLSHLVRRVCAIVEFSLGFIKTTSSDVMINVCHDNCNISVCLL